MVKTIDTLITLVLARIFTLLPNYLTLLKKLEVGVFFFCWRCHREAKAMPFHQARLYGDLDLADILKEQALSEYGHAQVFCQLTGSKLNMSGAGLMSREEKAAFDWGCVNWDSSGESYQADGMSTRYLSAKIFFGFRTANSYDWRDRIAFMYVLEEFQSCFYKQLLKFVPGEVQKELVPIADCEEAHAINLYALLWNLAGVEGRQKLVFWWRVRKYLGLICCPIDALYYLIKHAIAQIKRAI
ncbi:hypothetical protein VF14_03645 [Nostoc linckia z18]|uniref:Ferritin-like domain-containing protein n=2 Tax=Nostoc linckia TaxID=92942 RepID=A0A9Q5ZGY5_NOSLI|nr:hypothetical protein [Nostoc linckia]PHK41468.1 hypothetical protein VF12_06630 [Nostoc linckia z15]PHK46969.1 hypothetical protein VF13_08290 [Nostoc linckia z16]PHJ69230.1 hypothetical protein VF02_01115 [Nostoc linckia z1]PHJ73382.1 hypothetical protein VF05_02135 [Nostoc linckia z3]PHJ78729.1 hypothetical protein VF03_01120 [Nostoc linckia z2]